MLGAIATVLLGTTVNWASALLADAAILFYVFVYTMALKRRTPSNIVIGGAAGCFPVLIGWSAVTGTVGWPAAVLFLIVFLWTPPHFWALAIRFRDDYASAGVPMLPVVASAEVVARKILFYSYAMVAASLLLVPVGHPGWLYADGRRRAGRGLRDRGASAAGADPAGGQPAAVAPVPLVHDLPEPVVRGPGGLDAAAVRPTCGGSFASGRDVGECGKQVRDAAVAFGAGAQTSRWKARGGPRRGQRPNRRNGRE